MITWSCVEAGSRGNLIWRRKSTLEAWPVQVNVMYGKSNVLWENSSPYLHWKSPVIFWSFSMKPEIERRGGHICLTQQTNGKDRLRIGVTCTAAECSILYEQKNQTCEKQSRSWIWTAAHFTYGSRHLKFYLNIRWIYCMIWNSKK